MLGFIMLVGSIPKTYAQEIDAPKLRVVVNRQRISTPVEPIVNNEQTSLPLRCISEALGARVDWDPENRAAAVTMGGNIMICEGKLINGTMMAPLDFFTMLFDANIKHFQKTNIITVTTKGDLPSEKEAMLLAPDYKNYSEEDLSWMAKIVEAEATGEAYDSKLGVANVIINRRESGKYPSTIKGVIFDHKNGVQFTPTMNGAVYNEPSSASFMAALDALEGRNNAPSTLFFLNPRYATNNWVQRNRQFAFTIGGHNYYY
jgi:N-acetylmuramoyl-L-alanine amidase